NPAAFNQWHSNSLSGCSVEWNPELLGGINIIRERSNGNEQVLIPYYAWSNRGVGKMKVWKNKESIMIALMIPYPDVIKNS
ncbi:MAG: hypothetical protein LBQ73_01195, partial [Tannerellaceae bacterium]|nr:hypothetical protein [Tannerellaceae bacterium]